MGIFGGCVKLCTFGAVVLAIAVGWLSTHEHPIAVIFATVFKLQGFGKPTTEPVPDDFKPRTRPEGEMLFDLPGGDTMPANGLGMCCRPTAYDPVAVHRTVLWYLLQGGRHIDTAALYLNHEPVGMAIKDAVARGIPRKEIFLTTKVWGDNFGFEASVEKTKRMVKELGVDYIDLVLIHAPVKLSFGFFGKFLAAKLKGGNTKLTLGSDPEQVQLRLDTWRGLSTLRDAGLIRNIGVSNFNIVQMKEIQDLQLSPIAANQMQYHPWAPDWMKDIVTYCHQHKIVVTGYFSLGGHDNKKKAFEVEKLNEIAKSHGRRPAQILLRWSLQKNVSIIPGTGNHKHMADNLATTSFSLSNEDMKHLDGMSSLPISKDFAFFEF